MRIKMLSMIHGVHFLLYSTDPEADRAFLRDVLGFRFVDGGHGWLIFALPPAELAVHPAGGTAKELQDNQKLSAADVYLMCDDLPSTIADLAAKEVACTEVHQERWGVTTSLRLPSGASLGLYEPRHPLAIEPRSA
jgi:predicted enzyme related to lactoylglutathione lyase